MSPEGLARGEIGRCRSLPEEQILDQRGSAQDERDQNKQKNEAQRPIPDNICVVEHYVGHAASR
jgi:hypothetical protein